MVYNLSRIQNERPANKSQVEISEILLDKMGTQIKAASRLFFETAANQ